MSDLKSELRERQINLGLLPKIYCDRDETETFHNLEKSKQPLPEDVGIDGTGYYRCGESDLSGDEIRQLLLFRQIQYLRTIKNCAIYFVVISITGTLLSLLTQGTL